MRLRLLNKRAHAHITAGYFRKETALLQEIRERDLRSPSRERDSPFHDRRALGAVFHTDLQEAIRSVSWLAN
jgi:hypothetical protein